MKILIQHTDTFPEDPGHPFLANLADEIIREQIALIMLHNVRQPSFAASLPPESLAGYFSPDSAPDISGDNPAFLLADALRKKGRECSWIWFSGRREAGEEPGGMAVLAIGRSIRAADRFCVSIAADKERPGCVLGVQLEGLEDWFYCLSANPRGFSEGFLAQWKLLNCCVTAKRLCGAVWLMGNLGMPEEPETAALLRAGGWYDRQSLESGASGNRKDPQETGSGPEIWCSCPRAIRPAETYYTKETRSNPIHRIGTVTEVLLSRMGQSSPEKPLQEQKTHLYITMEETGDKPCTDYWN